MIAWLNPSALWGLALLAGPVLVHLLQRHRADRVLFPTLRFVQPSRLAAARMRLPSDVWLLLVRLAICALAVVAIARPLVVTPSRRAAWNQRVARAVVVDTSASMRAAQNGNGSLASDAVTVEARGADSLVRVDEAQLTIGLTRAVAMVSKAAPARREIVVISDFQNGTLTARDLEAVPASIGLRFVPVGALPVERRFDARPLLGVEADAVQHVRLSKDSTSVTVSRAPSTSAGLRLVGGDTDALLRIVASSGAPAASPEQPLLVLFAGAAMPAAARPIPAGWMLRTVMRLREDPDVVDAARDADALVTRAEESTWFVICRDAGGRPIVRASASATQLVIDAPVAASSYMAAAVVRGTLLARTGLTAYPEQEVERLPPDVLARLARHAAPAGHDMGRQADVSDARWCWAAALAMLGVEALVRRPRRAIPSPLEA